jgi:hypothetical protein
MKVSGQLHDQAAYPIGKEPPSTYWVGDWVGPKAVLDAVEYRNISCPYRESNPDCPARSLSLYPLSYPGSLIKMAGKIIYIFTI